MQSESKGRERLRYLVPQLPHLCLQLRQPDLLLLASRFHVVSHERMFARWCDINSNHINHKGDILMGWSYRKSKSFGPLRISGGKRGLSASVGGKHARAGINSRGKKRVSAGLFGFRWTKLFK